LLAKVAFNSQLREGGDAGNPLVLTDESVFATFNSILEKVIIRPKSLVGVRLGVST
jgi:ATP-binding protein involved in chromosome partitioning